MAEVLQYAGKEEKEKEKEKVDGGDSLPEVWYPSTANPNNVRNIELHRNRFRKQPAPSAEYFKELYKTEEWRKDHITLDEMPVSRFHMHISTQRLIHKMQVTLVDQAYEAFGKTEGSWDKYTLMFRNGWSNVGDKRKPVTEIFQQYCEEVYRPLMCRMLFGDGWERIRPHWGSFKSCTIKVCEGDENFLGKKVFHMHIDGKVGLKQAKNYAQRQMSRLLFSVVHDVLDDPNTATSLENGTTVYPIYQPRLGFPSNQAFHAYMQTKYREVGLQNSGLPRPHYEMPEHLLYRAVSGEVLFHFTHSDGTSGPQAIHSEPNPCPDRHLYVFDWNNIVAKDESGNYLPSIPVPEEEIIDCMRVLGEFGTAEFEERLKVVRQLAMEMMDKAAQYPGGQEILEEVIAMCTMS